MEDNKEVKAVEAEVVSAPAKPKSYTERFMDMEGDIDRIKQVINLHAGAIQQMMQQMQMFAQELDRLAMVRKTVNAIMKLSEEGVSNFSLQNVAVKVEELDVKALKEQLANDLSSGNLEKVNEVSSEETIVEFQSVPDGKYGVISLKAVKEDLRKEFLGKKVGDIVSDVSLIGLYVPKAKEMAAEHSEVKNEESTETPQQ